MHGKRITLRSAKWGVTKQEQHQSLGLAYCTAKASGMVSPNDIITVADQTAQR